MARSNRRRRKLVRLDLQLKVVFITLFVASLVLLINFQLSLTGLWSLEQQFQAQPGYGRLLDEIKALTIQKFLFSVAMAVPLAGFVGVLYSFKFCGPIYKFKKYFSDLAHSRWDERCMLRNGDDLQDVCDAINDGFGRVRDRVRESHTLCEDMSQFLEQAVFTVDGQTQALLDRIKTGLESEREVYAQHFDARVPTSAAGEEEASVEGEAKVSSEANAVEVEEHA